MEIGSTMFTSSNRSENHHLRKPLKRTLHFESLEDRRLLSANMQHDTSVVVTDTLITTSHDVVPRFVVNPTDIALSSGVWSDPTIWADGTVPQRHDSVRIDNGILVQFDTVAEIDALEILGQLDFATQLDTSLTVTTITVLPAGMLTLGTMDHPIADAVSAEIVFRDTPLLTGTSDSPGVDPSQYGNGLLVFGELITDGADKTPFVRAASNIHRGDTSIQLPSVPSDWQVGDTLLLPKTSQDPVLKRGVDIDETETVIISAIEGDVVLLVESVRFDHLGISENPLDISVFAHVSNLSRNITLRSENPEGIRGHVFVSGQGSASIHDTHSLSLGRTRSDVQLDSTVVDSGTGELYIGTNQVARYALHFHHLQNSFAVVNSVVQDNLKWGITVHDTDNGLVQGNIVYDTDGSGVMVESGTEVGNRFLDNLVVKVDGGPFQKRGGVQKVFDHFGKQVIQTGGDGSGFWFRSSGSAGTVEGNAVYDAASYGYNFNSYYAGGYRGTVDSFAGNETVSSKGGLWLSWSQGQSSISDNYQRQVFEDFLVWHTRTGVLAFHDGLFTLRNVTVIGNASVSNANDGSPTQILARSSLGIHLANPSYENFDVILEGIRVTGQNIGLSQAVHEGEQGTILRDAVFANYVNVLFWEASDQSKLSAENVSYLPSMVSKISASNPDTVADRFAIDTGTLEIGELSDTLPPIPPALPAALQIRNGVLRITGSGGNDEIIISESGDSLTVTSQGQEFVIDRALVTSYLLFANDGNDYFENRTSLNGIVFGGRGDDTLIGGSGNDSMRGEDGNDIIEGGSGDDYIKGDDGDDTILGGEGADKIHAGNGNDVVDGGAGNDPILTGGAGDDVVRGGTGNDTILGDLGDDQLFGGEGNDSMNGGTGDDLLSGGNGDDLLYGGDGSDKLEGGPGVDRLRGGPGPDRLTVDPNDLNLEQDDEDTFVVAADLEKPIPPTPSKTPTPSKFSSMSREAIRDLYHSQPRRSRYR